MATTSRRPSLGLAQFEAIAMTLKALIGKARRDAQGYRTHRRPTRSGTAADG
jgi:hypothetical protein